MVHAKVNSAFAKFFLIADYQQICHRFLYRTEEDHQESLSLMQYCHYDLAYMYFYSERPEHFAARRFKDDIPEESKEKKIAGND
ncbi:MAG: hypothetical protein WDM71_06320 [Ferruginibacter sp.]